MGLRSLSKVLSARAQKRLSRPAAPVLFHADGKTAVKICHVVEIEVEPVLRRRHGAASVYLSACPLNGITHFRRILCASLQATVIDILMSKLRKAAKDLYIKEVAVAGGVSANSGLREAFLDHAKRYGWKVHIPKFAFPGNSSSASSKTSLESISR